MVSELMARGHNLWAQRGCTGQPLPDREYGDLRVVVGAVAQYLLGQRPVPGAVERQRNLMPATLAVDDVRTGAPGDGGFGAGTRSVGVSRRSRRRRKG
jgi:hypothetical protein